MRNRLLKLLGAKTDGLSAVQRESCARTLERAACTLEVRGHDSLAAELRATGLLLIDRASRPYVETEVPTYDGPNGEGMTTRRTWAP